MKSRKIFALVAALVMCVSMLAACGGGSGTKEDTIKIGFIGPLSGGTAQYGEAVRNGAESYFNEVNAAGGIDGKQIEFIPYDSKGDNADATAAYSKLVDIDGVCAIIGPVLTGETLAVAELAADDGVPLITASATGDTITDIGDSLFRTCFKDSFQGTKMADYISQKLGYKKVAVLFNNADDYSVGLASAFREQAKKNGLEIVTEESYSTDDTDFKAQLTNIKAKAPDAVFFPFYYDQCYMASQQAKEIGLAVPFLGGDGLSGLCTIEGVDPTVIEGYIFSDHFSADGGNDGTKTFSEKYKATYGVEPMGFSFLACDGAQIVVEAIKTAGSTEWADIVSAMKNSDIDCLTGHYTFDADNNPIKKCAMTKVEGGKNVFVEMF
ncbi:MAG: ABC transporter substrate-binding protein [Oscillospiraceae bacterium]